MASQPDWLTFCSSLLPGRTFRSSHQSGCQVGPRAGKRYASAARRPAAVANDPLTVASDGPAAAEANAVHRTLNDGAGAAPFSAPEPSTLRTVDDINAVISMVDEFQIADLRLEDGDTVIEITRPGGRGFVNGELREYPAAEASSSGSQVETQNVAEGGATEYVEQQAINAEAQEVPGQVPAGDGLAASQSQGVGVEAPADPNKIYDTDFVVTSNRVGFFYSGARNKPPLVSVGDHVDFNQPVCIIEQLGQQYVYLSEVSGTVVQVFIEDGDAVQYDEKIMVIRPD